MTPANGRELGNMFERYEIATMYPDKPKIFPHLSQTRDGHPDQMSFAVFHMKPHVVALRLDPAHRLTRHEPGPAAGLHRDGRGRVVVGVSPADPPGAEPRYVARAVPARHRAPACQRTVKRGAQSGARHGLEQVVACTHVERAHRVLLVGCDDDHRRRLGELAEHTGYLEPVQPRRRDARKHHVVATLLDPT